MARRRAAQVQRFVRHLAAHGSPGDVVVYDPPYTHGRHLGNLVTGSMALGRRDYGGAAQAFAGAALGQVAPRKKAALVLMGFGALAMIIAGTVVYAGSKPGGFLRKLPAVPGIQPYFVQLASKWADYYGVPLQWVLATILAESGGNPNAVGDYHVLPEGASVGLMQVNWNAHGPDMTKLGLTRASLFDPDINIQWGVKIFRKCLDRVRSAMAGRSGDIGLLTRLCYTGVNTPGTIVAGGDPLSCPSCPVTSQRWGERLAQTAAAA